jgi:Fe-S oxidoreductase/nitrate reductase gamma subunit
MNPLLTAILLVVGFGLLSWSLARRFLPLTVMQPDLRWDAPVPRAGDVIKYGLGQFRFLQRFEWFHGLAHILIFWGALVVTINTIHVVGRGFVPDWHLPFFGHDHLGPAYAFAKDLFTLAVMLGCGLALYNRVFNRPARMLHTPEALIILLWIFSMMVMDWLYSSTLFVLVPDHPEQQTSFFGVLGRQMLVASGLTAADPITARLHAVGFWGHLLLAFSFLNYLPYCKQFHELTSLPALFLRSRKPVGTLARQDFEDEDAIFGVGKIEEFSWKRGLDMYSCAECGRCQANCPAHLTGKPLSPMRLIMEEREHLKDKTPLMWRAALARRREGPEAASALLEQWEGPALAGGVIAEDVIWSCTTCGHCITNCPLMIEHVDHIIDLRRYLVQVESRFPKELRQTFKGFENLSNPWGLASNTRGDWIAALSSTGAPAVPHPENKPHFKYLFYVGCAGSFDDRYRKTTMAVARLLQAGGIDFVCLGNDEMCCGETARRAGNEYLAQHLINFNLEMFDTIGVKKIITACPHCFNTFKNEYPQFGKTFEVIHHTEMIRDLIRKGAFGPLDAYAGLGPVVFHDPCYLGRYNRIYDAPREIAECVPGVRLVEAERRKRISFCCGGGGVRMWMEEKIGTRINAERCDQLRATGAKTIATACPYCMIMLDDAIKDKGLADDIKIMDLAQMVEGAMVKHKKHK